MPRLPKIIINRTALFVTTRTEEGLPLVATGYMEAIVEGILARAQHLYPVQVCHYKFMANHFHMVLKVDNPEDVPAFLDRVKTELAHAINRLLGRKKRRIWSEGYDSAVLLTKEDVIDKIAYLYTNAQRAGLVDKIDEYPGVSSWEMFISGNTSNTAPWIHRPAIPALTHKPMGLAEQQALTDMLLSEAEEEHTFRLSPYGWLECFNIPESEAPAIRGEVIRSVRAVESELRVERLRMGKHVVGKRALMLQSLFRKYVPKKFGRRMLCICRDLELRKRFIDFVKSLTSDAIQVLRRWREGNQGDPFPPGLFPPPLPLASNLTPAAVFGW